MSQSLQPLETQELEFEYLGHRIRLHPKITEIGTPHTEDDFRTLSVVLESPARIIRLTHALWGADMVDRYWAFERGMRRRSKKGQARWMKYDRVQTTKRSALTFLKALAARST
jgi:hypothetical protein